MMRDDAYEVATKFTLGTILSAEFSMGLRITSEELLRELIRVDGTLNAENLEQLTEVCRSKRQPLILDLSGMVRADESAVNFLKKLRDDGAILHGTRPYVTMLLESN